MEKYSYLIKSSWDREFLLNSAYVGWFENQLTLHPFGPNQTLKDYVTNRIHSNSAHSAPPSTSNFNNNTIYSNNNLNFNQSLNSNSNSNLYTSSNDYTSNSYSNNSITTPNFTFPANSPSNQMQPIQSDFQYLADDGEEFDSHSISQPQYYQSSSSQSIDPSLVLNQNAPSILHPPTFTTTSKAPPPQYHSNRPIKPFSPANTPPLLSTSKPIVSKPSNVMSAMESQGQLLVNERDKSNKSSLSSSTTASTNSTSVPTTVKVSPNGKGKQVEAFIEVPTKPTKTASTTTAIASTSKSTKQTSSTSTTTSTTTTKPSTTAAVASTSKIAAKPKKVTELERWNTYFSHLRDLLTASRLSKAPNNSLGKLAECFNAFSTTSTTDTSTTKTPNSIYGDQSLIPPESRIEILKLLIENGKSEFFDLLVKDEVIMLGVKVWFNSATDSVKEKVNDKLVTVEGKMGISGLEGTLEPILKLYELLPFTFSSLKKYSIGARVKRASTHSNTRIANLAATIVTKWSNALPTTPTSAVTEKGKEKRKATTNDDAAEPKKKVKTTATTNSTTSKASSSTSAPVAKPVAITFARSAPLPNFSKKKEVNESAFERASKSMTAEKRKAHSSAAKIDAESALVKNGNKDGKIGKNVKNISFKEGNELAVIKKFYIDAPPSDVATTEVEVVDDIMMDEGLNEADMEATRDEKAKDFKKRGGFNLDRQEGVSLKEHLDQGPFDEAVLVDWYQPIPVDIPKTEDFAAFYESAISPEVDIQTVRESTCIVTDSAFILESPYETLLHLNVEDESEPLPMLLSQHLIDDPVVQQEIHAAQLNRSQNNLADSDALNSILELLNTNGNNQGSTSNAGSSSTLMLDAVPDFNGLSASLQLAGYAPNSQEYQNREYLRPSQQQMPIAQASAWTSNSAQYNYPPTPLTVVNSAPANTRGRGVIIKGREGRGRNRPGPSSAPCKFYGTPGGCERGDSCRYVH